MRLSSILALVVVTASFALGGCAADAEPADTTPNVALSDPNADAVERDRTQDVVQTGKITDLYAHPTNETVARAVETWSGGTADPRIDAVPSGFDAVPREKLGLQPLHPPSALELGARVEPGLTPYMHDK